MSVWDYMIKDQIILDDNNTGWCYQLCKLLEKDNDWAVGVHSLLKLKLLDHNDRYFNFEKLTKFELTLI